MRGSDRIALTFAALVVLGLVGLVVRELVPRRAAIPRDAPVAVEAASAPAPELAIAAPAPATPAAAPARPADDGLAGARTLASVIRHPESSPAEGVFHDRMTGIDQYAYEGVGPYRRWELQRDANDADVWEIDGSNGAGHPTKLEDVAPRGAIREAATVRDANGAVIGTWYAIEAAPLAPAFATTLATGGTRILSRAYVEANRASLPDALTAALDRVTAR